MLFFAPKLQRLVRLWGKDVAVLEGDAWRTVKPKGFAYGLVSVDPRTGETLVLADDKALRFDLASFDKVADVGPEPTGGTDQGRVFVPHPRGRRLLLEDRGDPSFAWQLDLGPAFDRAAKL